MITGMVSDGPIFFNAQKKLLSCHKQLLSSSAFLSMNSILPEPPIPPDTFLLVNPDDHNALVPADADEFVYGADSPAGQLAEQDHAFDVVVLQQADIGPHLSNGAHVHHHYIFHLREFVLVEPTA